MRTTPLAPLSAPLPAPLPAALPALLLAGLLTTAPATHAAEAAAPLQTVARVDLPRYMGTWYEIARFPNRFQRQCSGPATATYTLQPSGTVQVLNRCPQADGKTDQALGEARLVGEAGTPKLQVRFAPAFLSFLPMVWGNYWVVDLDEAYTLAAVSEPQREYLWVLSRTPTVAPAAWDALMQRLTAQGLDLSRLQRVAP